MVVTSVVILEGLFNASGC